MIFIVASHLYIGLNNYCELYTTSHNFGNNPILVPLSTGWGVCNI